MADDAEAGDKDGRKKAEDCSGKCEPVGEPEVFCVENGQGYEQPAKDGVASQLEDGYGDGFRGWKAAEEGWAEPEPDCGPEDSDSQFDEWIAEADRDFAVAAAATKDEPAQDGDVFPTCEGVVAVAAVGSRRGDAFVFGVAGEDDVEEAAEGETEQGYDQGADELEGIGGHLLFAVALRSVDVWTAVDALRRLERAFRVLVWNGSGALEKMGRG